jgi:hypothetical protein
MHTDQKDSLQAPLSDTNQTILLVLNIIPELEEDLVDYLLSLDRLSGFTSYATHGHGEQEMTITEEVLGRRKRMQFEIIIDVNDANTLLDGLQENVGTGIHYWQLPLVTSGRI